MNAEVKEMASRLGSDLAARKVYLFGSHARGEDTAESDYDFYVIVPDESEDLIALEQKAYKSLRGLRHRPVDILVGKESTFAARREQATIENSVDREGILLYGA